MSVSFLGPGMSGPEVSRVQRLIGATMTGVYDEETTQTVRGLQVLHGLDLKDGCWDAKIEQAVTRRP